MNGDTKGGDEGERQYGSSKSKIGVDGCYLSMINSDYPLELFIVLAIVEGRG